MRDLAKGPGALEPKIEHAIAVLAGVGATVLRSPSGVMIALPSTSAAAAPSERVDAVAHVGGPPRPVMTACRLGKIVGAVRVGRRWIAPRAAVDAWLASLAPRQAPTDLDEDEDELEPLRRALGGTPTPRRSA